MENESFQFEERMLNMVLNHYFSFGDHLPQYETRERISTINNMQIIIYSNDHNPPHFHVKSLNNKINAKFTIQDCELISGDINSKDMKKIQAFFNDIKTRLTMERIWNKKNQ